MLLKFNLNFLSGFLMGSLKEDSKGGKPLAYWGIFSGSVTEREENALISYGVFFKTSCGIASHS
jgi:hypothetical protein